MSDANLEQVLLKTVRSLSQAQQETVLHFARSLQSTSTNKPLSLSLQEIAKLSVVERNQILAAYIPNTAKDFLNDPELTEFSILDSEDWEE